MKGSDFVPSRRTLVQVVGVLLLGFCFANLEIQIEGSAGWAAHLPTWRIPPNWLLDIFWGGREMTGYHAWVLTSVALFFHWPILFNGRWSWPIQARLIACILLFWLAEDFLWFARNPAYGLARFDAAHVPWHHWIGPLPSNYLTNGPVVLVLFFLSGLGAAKRKRL
jgi:hypothetical protein